MDSKYDTFTRGGEGFRTYILCSFFFLSPPRVLGVFCACRVSKKLLRLVFGLSVALSCLYGYLWVDGVILMILCACFLISFA